MKYYYLEIFERNGNYEYHHKHVHTSDEFEDGQTPEEFAEDRAKNFYTEGDPEGDYYWHYGELITKVYCIKEIPKEEYDVLNKYIY